MTQTLAPAALHLVVALPLNRFFAAKLVHLGYRPAPELTGPQKGFDCAAGALAAHRAAAERDLRAMIGAAQISLGRFSVRIFP
ncbi:hypothetical protein [Roseomonas sp. WA12]